MRARFENMAQQEKEDAQRNADMERQRRKAQEEKEKQEDDKREQQRPAQEPSKDKPAEPAAEEEEEVVYEDAYGEEEEVTYDEVVETRPTNQRPPAELPKEEPPEDIVSAWFREWESCNFGCFVAGGESL